MGRTLKKQLENGVNFISAVNFTQSQNHNFVNLFHKILSQLGTPLYIEN